MLRWSLAVVSSVLALASAAVADMGRVVVRSDDVTVGESAQKAVILHNGREEVLVLGTELSASRTTPIIRFIPFPAEPKVALAPPTAFERIGAIAAKYELAFRSRAQMKGGAGQASTQAVEVLTSTRLGAHDLTVVRIRDAAMFRAWVTERFRGKGLPSAESWPAEEAIVADYVARGLDYFVLDYVEVPKDKRFIEPIAYRFASKELYYPLKTSNSFGGEGEIDLFIVAPVTLCVPGSNDPIKVFRGEDHDLAVGAKGEPLRRCLNLPVKASTSARLVPDDGDLAGVYPGWEAFFDGKSMFIQAIRYKGPYDFKDDVLVPLVGTPKALRADRCELPPQSGPCKANFEGYSFDPVDRTCKRFVWGGCGPAPFDNQEECEKFCAAR